MSQSLPSKPETETAVALQAYWRYHAQEWWKANPNRLQDAVCDSCNSSITPDNSFYFVEGRRMKCQSCTDRSLRDWEQSGKSVKYFGSTEIDKAKKFYLLSNLK